jgi:type II secretory pathway pseudopilin PulG
MSWKPAVFSDSPLAGRGRHEQGEPVRRHYGFTLLEIVIMLVILGLLLGGVLKGQELITNVRVRSLISQQDDVRAAFVGFVDRYQAYPGDYGQAQANIPGCSACAQGNRNGKIQSVDGGDAIDEHIAAWEHLSRAGFINVNYSYAASPEIPTSAPTSPFGRYLRLLYDNAYGTGTSVTRHNLKTGNQIPSDILAEVDRKIDDGVATTGMFQFSAYNGGSSGSTVPIGPGTCYQAAVPNNWNAGNPAANCGGAGLF